MSKLQIVPRRTAGCPLSSCEVDSRLAHNKQLQDAALSLGIPSHSAHSHLATAALPKAGIRERAAMNFEAVPRDYARLVQVRLAAFQEAA